MKSYILYAPVLLYALLTFAVRPAGNAITVMFPENYRWRAMSTTDQSDIERIYNHRLEQEDYDFTARNDLASLLLTTGRAEEAKSILRETLRRENAVSGRNVYNSGMDPRRSRELLSRALAGLSKSAESRWFDREATRLFQFQGGGIIQSVDGIISTKSQE